MYPDQRLLLAVVAKALICEAAGTIQLPWTTDSRALEDFEKTFGPDGPWQAVAVYAGNLDDEDNNNNLNGFPGVPVPLWPSGLGISEFPTSEATESGKYSGKDSTSAVATGASREDTDAWFGKSIANISSHGMEYFDTIVLPGKTDYQQKLSINTSVVALDENQMLLPDGREVSQPVGILGLGPYSEAGERGASSEDYPSILDQLKSDDKIGSASFGVHIGSASLDQPGSLILGGYERNRIIGRPGAFTLRDDIPVIPLVDVTLGVETGGSPFDDPEPFSVYRGLGDEEAGIRLARDLGTKEGSALVVANPAVPYIYLPPGTCEEAAKHLPVTLDEALGLYLWNTEDPQYERIVKSPAYLAFTLSDKDATNTTIKVPFALLDLTLTKPMAEKQTPYFPCKSASSGYGFWMLGRAFLQAAHLAVNYDSQLLFLAQAPGPGLEQSVIEEMGGSDETLEGIAEGKFVDSWRETWTALPGGEDEGEGDGLGSGAIAGIVVGAVAGLGIAAAAAFFWMRRKNRAGVGRSPVQGMAAEKSPTAEMYAPGVVHEAPAGEPLTQEMDSPVRVHEAPGESGPAELAAFSAGNAK